MSIISLTRRALFDNPPLTYNFIKKRITIMSNTKNILIALSVGTSLFSQLSLATDSATINQFLKEFNQNPAKKMNERLKRRANNDGSVLAGTTSAQRIKARQLSRNQICDHRNKKLGCVKDLGSRAGFTGNEEPADFTDNGDSLVRSIEQMDHTKLTNATLSDSPWSDTYWPIYAGVLGYRYSESGFPASSDWKANFDYVNKDLENNGDGYKEKTGTSLDDLSPSEKYDLLVGDANMTLTKKMWAEGQYYYDNSPNHEVESWMGICHGWAPAAFMFARPKGTIELVSAVDNQTKLRFYPSDIKGLASLLWAKVNTSNKFLGGRCDIKSDKIKTDPATGRILNPECFDTNPGAWHLSIVNQLGVAKRSFVMDATFDYQVWNQPILSYHYRYFNPTTQTAVSTLKEAMVDYSQFTNDKFKSYRSNKTKYVVGVSMDVVYIAETQPTHRKTDSADRDGKRTVNYMYDLEIDSVGNIIGGEWYDNAHPDFLWMPYKDETPMTPYDRPLADIKWDTNGAVPSNWGKAAQRASNNDTPLYNIVQTLVDLSQMLSH